MGAIQKYLIRRGDTSNYLQGVFKKGKEEVGERGLMVADMVLMLRAAIASTPQVFICMDQCSEPSSPSVLKVVKNGPPVVVRLFSSPWTS